MKISEYRNLKEFLSVIFSFFRENGIVSSIRPVEDYSQLLERILESEFNYISYYSGMYCADFKLSTRIETGEVYYFIFGGEGDSASLLIDLGERNLSSFFNFTWNPDKHPPFLKDFIDDDGRVKVESEAAGGDPEYLQESDILSFEEFADFLGRNNKQGLLNIVVVE